MRLLRAFGWFWWDLVIGDDWRIAAYVVLVLGAGAGLAAAGAPDPVIALGAVVALMTCFAGLLVRDVRR